MRALGDGEAARRYFAQSLAIAARLVQAEPQRADYQWDLVASLVRIADSDAVRRAAHLTRALGVLRALHEAGRLFPEQIRWMRILEERLGS
jgi:hypothetical protein